MKLKAGMRGVGWDGSTGLNLGRTRGHIDPFLAHPTCSGLQFLSARSEMVSPWKRQRACDGTPICSSEQAVEKGLFWLAASGPGSANVRGPAREELGGLL